MTRLICQRIFLRMLVSRCASYAYIPWIPSSFQLRVAVNWKIKNVLLINYAPSRRGKEISKLMNLISSTNWFLEHSPRTWSPASSCLLAFAPLLRVVAQLVRSGAPRSGPEFPDLFLVFLPRPVFPAPPSTPRRCCLHDPVTRAVSLLLLEYQACAVVATLMTNDASADAPRDPKTISFSLGVGAQTARLDVNSDAKPIMLLICLQPFRALILVGLMFLENSGPR